MSKVDYKKDLIIFVNDVLLSEDQYRCPDADTVEFTISKEQAPAKVEIVHSAGERMRIHYIDAGTYLINHGCNPTGDGIPLITDRGHHNEEDEIDEIEDEVYETEGEGWTIKKSN